MPDRPDPRTGRLPGPGNPVRKPKGPGSSGGGGQGVQVQGDSSSPCLVSFPSAGIPLVGSVGGGCLLSKTNVRAMVGGLLIGAGAVITLGGAAVLAVAGFRKTGAAQKIAGVAESVPGGVLVGAAVRGAGGDYPAAARGIRRHRRAGAAADAALEWRVGQPRENTNLRTGRGAVRESAAGTRRRRAERPASREETGF